MLRLDAPRPVGALRVALLCEQRINSLAWKFGLLHFHGRMVPVAVPIAEGTCL